METRYSRQKLRGMLKSCRFTQEETNTFMASVNTCSETDHEFRDLVPVVTEMLCKAGRKKTGQEENGLLPQDRLPEKLEEFAPECFARGDEQYQSCVRMGTLLIRMLDEERSVYERVFYTSRRTEEMLWGLVKPSARSMPDIDICKDSAEAFARDYGDLLENPVLAVFMMEAAADVFENNLLRSEGRTKGQFRWMRQIFRKLEFYGMLLRCYVSLRRKNGDGVDEFFLQLFLLYRFLAPDYGAAVKKFHREPHERRKHRGCAIGLRREQNADLHNDGNEPENMDALYHILNMIAPKQVREKNAEAAQFDVSDIWGGEKNDVILRILQNYIAYVCDRDIEKLLEGISDRVSRMAFASASILIDELADGEEDYHRHLCLYFIEGAMFRFLFINLTGNYGTQYEADAQEYDVWAPEGGYGGIVFVRQKRRQMIRISYDQEAGCVKAASRNGHAFIRRTDAAFNWNEDDLRAAGDFCRKALEHPQEGSSFLFSYVCLENYRTIDRLEVSFDHRFSLEKGKLVRKSPGLSSAYFYGKPIYSLTCLVGRNGAGKSSVVDFLRESFLAMKHDAEEGRLTFEGQRLCLTEEDEKRYHLLWGDQPTRFLVVFRVEEKDWFLTNFTKDEIDLSGIERVRLYQYREAMNFTEQDCTFAYFSQFRYPTGMYSFQHLSEEDEFRENLSRYVRDLCEESSEKQRLKNDANESLIHQLVFLLMAKADDCVLSEILTIGDCTEYDRLEIFDSSPRPNLFLKDLQKKDHKKRRSANAHKQEPMDKDYNARLIETIKDPEALIGQYSSGQHSRIALLSKLYWCLAGSRDFVKKYMERWPELCRQIIDFEAVCKTRLAETDTGVLFFDEGDLCFHPEWQRAYIRDIVQMVSGLRKMDVQIIVTTNSPFMLSDILREDVYSLNGSEAGFSKGFEPGLQTYGQNIHMLLAHRFFLDNTMGKMSEDALTWLFRVLRECREADRSQREDMLRDKVMERYGEYLKARRASESGTKEAADSSGRKRVAEREWGEESSDADIQVSEEAPGHEARDITITEIKQFLDDFIDNVGERVYRVALRDEFGRCFKTSKYSI